MPSCTCRLWSHCPTSSGANLSRLDYCNAMLAGLPASTIELLQQVHAAVRLIFQLWLKNHVTQGLHQLYWLPISCCITFKLCVQCTQHTLVTALLTLPRLSAAGNNQRCFNDSVRLLWATMSNRDSVPSLEKELPRSLVLTFGINFLLHCVRHLTSTPSRNNLKLTFSTAFSHWSSFFLFYTHFTLWTIIMRHWPFL